MCRVLHDLAAWSRVRPGHPAVARSARLKFELRAAPVPVEGGHGHIARPVCRTVPRSVSADDAAVAFAPLG